MFTFGLLQKLFSLPVTLFPFLHWPSVITSCKKHSWAPPVRFSASTKDSQGTQISPALVFMTTKCECLLICLSPLLGSKVHREETKGPEWRNWVELTTLSPQDLVQCLGCSRHLIKTWWLTKNEHRHEGELRRVLRCLRGSASLTAGTLEYLLKKEPLNHFLLET